MTASSRSKFLAAFSLIVWLHLLIDIYPTPLQRQNLIEQTAHRAHAAETEYLSYIPTDGEKSTRNLSDWKREITIEVWTDWAFKAIALTLGVAASAAVYRQSRAGLVATMILSGILMARTLPPAIELFWNAIQSESQFAIVWSKHLGTSYWVFVWPTLVTALLICAVCSLRKESQRRAA